MSEKAISIGHYFVASGVYTIFGVTFPSIVGTKFHDMLFGGLEEMGCGKWGFAVDPHEMAQKMIDHIDKKREALGIMGKKERKLFSMDDQVARRQASKARCWGAAASGSTLARKHEYPLTPIKTLTASAVLSAPGLHR